LGWHTPARRGTSDRLVRVHIRRWMSAADGQTREVKLATWQRHTPFVEALRVHVEAHREVYRQSRQSFADCHQHGRQAGRMSRQVVVVGRWRRHTYGHGPCGRQRATGRRQLGGGAMTPSPRMYAAQSVHSGRPLHPGNIRTSACIASHLNVCVCVCVCVCVRALAHTHTYMYTHMSMWAWNSP
jgi:hypothetical protein